MQSLHAQLLGAWVQENLRNHRSSTANTPIKKQPNFERIIKRQDEKPARPAPHDMVEAMLVCDIDTESHCRC
jgi:hypothetical protein